MANFSSATPVRTDLLLLWRGGLFFCCVGSLWFSFPPLDLDCRFSCFSPHPLPRRHGEVITMSLFSGIKPPHAKRSDGNRKFKTLHSAPDEFCPIATCGTASTPKKYLEISEKMTCVRWLVSDGSSCCKQPAGCSSHKQTRIGMTELTIPDGIKRETYGEQNEECI